MRIFHGYYLLTAATIGLTILIVGCDSPPAGKVKVTGTVEWQGEPLPDGAIEFFLVEGDLLGGAAQIEAGRFRFFSKPGKMRVQISASRPIPGASANELLSPDLQYIPERYNANSELTAEVTLDGKNHFVFSLTENPDESQA